MPGGAVALGAEGEEARLARVGANALVEDHQGTLPVTTPQPALGLHCGVRRGIHA